MSLSACKSKIELSTENSEHILEYKNLKLSHRNYVIEDEITESKIKVRVTKLTTKQFLTALVSAQEF